MPREKFKTLTEQMFYILLCLHQECRGMDILDMVRQMTNGRVNIGSGTLYDLLEQFAAQEIIRETKAEGRRRSYILTEKEQQMLTREYERLRCQMAFMNTSSPRRRSHERDQTMLCQFFLLRSARYPA